MSYEFLTGTKQASPTAQIMLAALIHAAREHGDEVIESPQYTGAGDVLVLYGVGAPDRTYARAQHLKSGRRAILWDLGYFHRQKLTGYLRCSINTDHPQRVLDQAPDDGSRWESLGVQVRNEYSEDGPIILVGLGRKSRAQHQAHSWEADKLKELRHRFPKRRIIYRPKPGQPFVPLPVDTDHTTPIHQLLNGASLVVCRHSNVAIDGVVQGIPFEAQDGAVTWLNDKLYTLANRLAFLRRLAWFQWKVDEARDAWRFVRTVTA